MKPSLTPTEIQQLIRQALTARQQAYAPYSHYTVGAALLTGDGSYYPGCNIENAAYSPSLCAERLAMASALQQGQHHWLALAICGGPQDCQAPLPTWAYPCGVCRQWLAEFTPVDFPVIVARSQDDYRLLQRQQLLPYAFALETTAASSPHPEPQP